MVIAIMWVNPNAINVNHPPNHHHFYRWYVYHSQSWVVYDIVLPTLKGIVFGQPQVEHSQGLGQSHLVRRIWKDCILTVDSHWAGPKIEVRVMAYHLVSGSQTLGLHRKLPQHSHPCLLLSRALQ